MNAGYQLRLIGYCSLDEEALLRRFLEQGPAGLSRLPGEYAVAVEREAECHIITSPYGVSNYYYTVQGKRLYHDDTVLGVLRQSRLPWSWNWRALGDYLHMDHLLENDTLHPEVHRVPPGTILSFRAGTLQTQTSTWEELHPPLPSDPQSALSAFNEAIRQWMTEDAVVSLSAGLDSRVILSSLLAQGCRPSLLTMGFEDSTDVVISREIARTLGLEHLVVGLCPEDFLDNGRAITALTNGTKAAIHWHTYVYPQKAQLGRERVLFGGTNGEFVRTLYLDKGVFGVLGVAANRLAPLVALKQFWRLKLMRPFTENEARGLCPELASQFAADGQEARIQRLMDLCHRQLLTGLDRFYVEQRVRNFYGNGIKLYAPHVAWRAPFLSPEWVRAVWSLNRSWKLGSNWHRFALAHNYPQLLDFPDAGRGPKTAAKASPLYWLPSLKKHPIRHFSKYPSWSQEGVIGTFIRDSASVLSEWIDPRTVIAIMDDHRQTGARAQTTAFLLSLIFWRLNLNESLRIAFPERNDAAVPTIAGAGKGEKR